MVGEAHLVGAANIFNVKYIIHECGLPTICRPPTGPSCRYTYTSGVARISQGGGQLSRGPQGNPYQKLKTHRIWFTIFWEGAQNHEQEKNNK